MIELNWFRCESVGWCDLDKVNIRSQTLKDIEGVYVLWTGTTIDDTRKVISVGQGMIIKIILGMRKSLEVKAFSQTGLYITWAELPPYRLNSVEVYLDKKLNPVIKNEDLPTVSPKQINLPWDGEDIFTGKPPDSDDGQLETRMPSIRL